MIVTAVAAGYCALDRALWGTQLVVLLRAVCLVAVWTVVIIYVESVTLPANHDSD